MEEQTPNTNGIISCKNMLTGSLPIKSHTLEFFNWVHKKYWKGMNGWIPYGCNPYSNGFTIEKLYDEFLKNVEPF